MAIIEEIRIKDPCEILCAGKQRTKEDCQNYARAIFKQHREVMRSFEKNMIQSLKGGKK